MLWFAGVLKQHQLYFINYFNFNYHDYSGLTYLIPYLIP